MTFAANLLVLLEYMVHKRPCNYVYVLYTSTIDSDIDSDVHL